MAEVPVTKVSLLGAIAASPENVRWTEFARRYTPMMEAFLAEHFPFLEKEDIIQDTLLALVKILPSYRYAPEETGHFHNYLTGILYRKAQKACTKSARRKEVMTAYKEEPKVSSNIIAAENAEFEWRKSIFEIALKELLADPSVKERTKQIFLRVAVKGEKPEDVAAAFGIERNAVDQARNRTMQKLKSIVAALIAVREEGQI